MYEDIEIEDGPSSKFQAMLARKWQHYLDLSAPHIGPRWALSAFIMMIYCLRVYLINGWYIITYGLGIYVLNLLIGFLSPQSDPETEGPVRAAASSGSRLQQQAAAAANSSSSSSSSSSTARRCAYPPLTLSLSLSPAQTLPTSRDDEFRPFIRRLPEFKFWYSLTKAFCIAFFMTFFSVFNIPVFWPILLLYFIALFVLTMKRQIKHMIKYKYVPFSFGKTQYKGKDDVVRLGKSAE